MINYKYRLCFAFVVLISLASCASTPYKVDNVQSPRTSYTEEDEGHNITHAAAKEVNAYNFVEIDFLHSSAALSKNAISSLEALIQQANQHENINQIIILSWADEEYPSKRRKRLSKIQTRLADERNSSIKKYFASRSLIDVETHNMAKQPNALSKVFNTTDAKLKNSLMSAGLPTTGDQLKYPSKASHAVILLKVDQVKGDKNEIR